MTDIGRSEIRTAERLDFYEQSKICISEYESSRLYKSPRTSPPDGIRAGGRRKAIRKERQEDWQKKAEMRQGSGKGSGKGATRRAVRKRWGIDKRNSKENQSFKEHGRFRRQRGAYGDFIRQDLCRNFVMNSLMYDYSAVIMLSKTDYYAIVFSLMSYLRKK